MMQQLLGRLIDTDDGQDLIEYALLLAFVALACIAAIINVGSALDGALNNADTQLRSDGGL